MAVAATVHPWPTSPPPARRIVAWRVGAAGLAADAVICLFIATMWLFFWGLAAMEIGGLACGEGSLVVAAASKVVAAAGLTLLPVLVLGVFPLFLADTTVGAATDIEADKAPAPPPRSFAAEGWEALRDPIILGALASISSALLLVVGTLLKGDSSVKGSRRERMGSVIDHVGTLVMHTVDCFAVCPILTVGIWRAWRMEA